MKLAKFESILTLSYWVFLFTMTHIPVKQIPHTGASDKLLHLVAYCVLAFLVASHLFLTRRWNRKAIIYAMLLLAFFAGFDELTQMLVGRSAEWKDWGADLLGIIIGTSLFVFFIYVFKKHRLVRLLLEPEK